MILPNEAEKDCDVPETVVSGSINKITIPLNNWGSQQVVMKKERKQDRSARRGDKSRQD